MKGQARSAENERDMECFSREPVTKDSNVYRHRGLIQWVKLRVVKQRGYSGGDLGAGIAGNIWAGMLSTIPR